MKATTLLLPLAATLGGAFVLPNEQVGNLQHVEMTGARGGLLDGLPSKGDLIDRLPSKDDLLDHLPSKDSLLDHLPFKKDSLFDKDSLLEKLGHIEDVAIDRSRHAVESVSNLLHETYFDAQGWLDSAISREVDMDEFDLFSHMPDEEEAWKRPCHRDSKIVEDTEEKGRGPSPPRMSEEMEDGHPPPKHGDKEHGPPGHHHKPGFHKSNLTVYQLIAKSNYTTKLAKLINEYPDLVEMLNGTAANYTIFAPTDRAFAKIPEHAPKPSKELLKSVLTYHVSSEFYPAGRVLVTRTVPTLLKSSELNGPQRLSTNIGPRGLTVNFYSRIVAVDIFGSNGVIHGVDSILIPPPPVLKIVQLLPTEFSTLELGLTKTGLFDEINSTAHLGGTLFAPSNFAFQKLGPRINAFLFSSFGQKYLKALLQYHVVANQTLYSDAFYKASGESEGGMFGGGPDGKISRPQHGPPRGFFHVDLPTALEGKALSIDVARWGRLIDIKINGFSRVTVSDGVAKDGVLHIVGDVLIPPKKLGEAVQQQKGEVLELEDLMERLEPYLEAEEEEGVWGDL